MKIEIEWTASYEAKVTIQETSFKVFLLPEPSVEKLCGEGDVEHTLCFASVLLTNLAPLIMGAMQAECTTDNYIDPSGERDNTFRSVPDYVAREANKVMTRYLL